MSYENFVTSANFLGYGIRWETSEPVSPKVGESYEIYFTVVLNTLCKTLTMFYVVFNSPFHYDCPRLIRSCIL